jgi:hypothetical protein
MKNVFWLLLAALLIWGWQNPERVRSTGDTVSKWVGEKSRAIADKWAPLPPPPPPEPEPATAGPARPLLPELPEGAYLLKQPVTVATGRGTVIWPMGLTIRKLGEGAGKVLVSDGENQTAVDAAIITRDPQERVQLEKLVAEANALKAKADSQTLERELAEVEGKISSLKAELNQVMTARQQLGRAPFGTNEDFLKMSITRHEERRAEIYKLLGRAAPRMVLTR